MVRKNIISMIIALIIMILSFASSSTFSRLDLPAIPHLDKLVHLAMYFTLTLALLYENREQVRNNRSCFFLGAIPLVFGGLIEILQSMFTTTRTGDFFDFLANATGILLSILIWILIKRPGRPAAR